MPEPTPTDMIRDLLEALGTDPVAQDAPPREVWERAVADAKAAMDLSQHLIAICASYGLPPNVDGLVRHIAGNAGMKSYLDAQFDQTMKLRHIGFWDPETGFDPTIDGIGGITVPGMPAFTHTDWPMIPPVVPEGVLPSDDTPTADDEGIVRG